MISVLEVTTDADIEPWESDRIAHFDLDPEVYCPMPARRRAGHDEFDSSTVSIKRVRYSAEWLDKHLTKLATLNGIGNDWCEGGAESPNQVAIDAAQTVLLRLAELGLEPNFIDPSTNEGVSISFRNGLRYANIECLNSGERVAVISRDDAGSKVWDIGPGVLHLIWTIRRILEFING